MHVHELSAAAVESSVQSSDDFLQAMFSAEDSKRGDSDHASGVEHLRTIHDTTRR